MRRATSLLIAGLLALGGAGCAGDDPDPAGGVEDGTTERDPSAIVAEINRLLDEVVASYEAGDVEAAGEHAAEAYLENYEHLEHDLEEIDEELNEEIEELLGAELRARISEAIPKKELRAMIATARDLLEQALDKLEGNP